MNTDLRIIKTHKAIHQAFIELLTEMPFEQVRVHHITERALVNRSTFYKYYSGKSDLAGKIIANLKNNFEKIRNQRLTQTTSTGTLQEMSELLFQQRHELLAMLSIKTRRHHLYQDIHTMIKDAFIHLANTKKGEKDWDYQADVYATIALETIVYYFSRDKAIPIKQTATDWREMMAIATAGI